MTRTSRRRVFAAAAFLAATPVLAACGAGQNANIFLPYNATEAVRAEQNGVTVAQAFVLGPDSGATLPAGASAPLYLAIVNGNDNPDTLTGVAIDDQSASSAKAAGPITLPPRELVNTGKPTPQITLEGFREPLRGGESVQLTLRFQNAGNVELSVPVVTRSREFATLPPVSSPAPSPSASPSPSVSAAGGGH